MKAQEVVLFVCLLSSIAQCRSNMSMIMAATEIVSNVIRLESTTNHLCYVIHQGLHLLEIKEMVRTFLMFFSAKKCFV